MKLKPLQDWVVIQSIEPEERTAAGIIIPDSAKDKPTEGIVIAIGPGKYKTEKGKEKEKKFIPTVLKPGQRIIYGKYSARDIELNGETITLVMEEEVLGTVEEVRLAEKHSFAVAVNQEKPVALKKETNVMTVAASPQKKKNETHPLKKAPLIKSTKKTAAASKSIAIEEKKRAGVVKKTEKDK